MRPKHNYLIYGILALAIIGVIFVSACTRPPQKCPDCQDPGTWSACTNDAIKTRTNYKCSVETNYSCESYKEEKACAVEIRLKGSKLDAVISPTLDEMIKGTIKIEVLSVPEKTEKVIFLLAPQGIQLGAKMSEEDAAKIEKGTDSNAADGWKYYLDTTKLNNGIYTIFIGPTYEGAPDENPWLDYTSTQLIISN